MQYKTLFLVLLVIPATFANWGLDLRTKVVKQSASDLYPLDEVVTVPIGLGKANIDACIDSTVTLNWLVTDTTTSGGQKKTIEALGGRGTLTGSKTAVTNIEFGGEQIKEANVFEATSDEIGADSEAEVLKAVKAGLAFGRGDSSFLYDIKKNVKLEADGFALVLDSKIAQLRIGVHETFFAQDSQYKKFNNFAAKGSDEWAIGLDKVEFQAQQVSGVENGFRAVFDTTTKYIWVPQGFFEDITKKLQTQFAGCTPDSANEILKCKCGLKYPNIDFYFDKDSKPFVLTANDYFEKVGKAGSQECVLLIRSATVFGDATTSAAVPDVSDAIYLGTSFLKAAYVYFDLGNDDIYLSPVYKVVADPIALDDQLRYVFVIGGAVVFVIFLVAMTSVITPVPYNEKTMSSTIQVQPQVHQQQAQPQQFAHQSYHQQQPQSFGQPVTVAYGQSPQRFVTTGLYQNAQQQFKPQ